MYLLPQLGTSQVKHLDARAVQHYTPEQVVDLARAHGIRMLSWTYNDPVVWHEVVVDTARLAARHGIQDLYKSAFYIEEEPVRELIDVIDVFSLSLKSMSAEFYRKATGGELQPVLDRICQVHASGRHLEISNLLVTDLNDTADDARKTVRWVLDHLGPHGATAFRPVSPGVQVHQRRAHAGGSLVPGA